MYIYVNIQLTDLLTEKSSTLRLIQEKCTFM